jgi:hypothetical protein
VQLGIVMNAGIGDIILTHAMLGQCSRPVRVGLCEKAICTARSADYRSFARSLFELLFAGDSYVIDYTLPGPGIDPTALAAFLSPQSPDLREVLPDDGPAVQADYVVVLTKIRGWWRHRYEAIRPRLLAALKRVAAGRLLVLVGEREVGQNAEYRHHGANYIYSIHEDLAGIQCLDLTVPELGVTPPLLADFRRDCRVLRDAAAVVGLGSGGNTTMAQACGNWVANIDQTEMEAFLRLMPEDPRHRLCRSDEEFLAAVEVLA